MRAILLIIFSFGILSTAFGQQVLFSEDFENYNNNQSISNQSPNITTWSSGTTDDALISQEQALSGSQSIKINGTSDLVVPFNNLTTGALDLEFNMLVPESSGGYFNIQKSSNPGVEWAFDVFIGDEGWHIVGGDTTFFDFPLGVWNKFALSIDLDEVTATISLNDNIISTWDWDQTTNETTGLNQIGGLNIFAGAPPNLSSLYYIDDMSATFTPFGTTNVEESNLNDIISIYPNPANSNISISIKDASGATVTIINSSGMIVKERILNRERSNIDINSLYSGIYFVKIRNGEKISTTKLLVH